MSDVLGFTFPSQQPEEPPRRFAVSHSELDTATNAELAAIAQYAMEILEKRINPSTGGFDDGHEPEDELIFDAYKACLRAEVRIRNKHLNTDVRTK